MTEHSGSGGTTRSRAATAPPPPDGSAAPADAGLDPAEELPRLRLRLADLQRERDHLIAVVDILQEISASLHFVDILQTIARKLGDAFGLDRCAIFLTGAQDEVRLILRTRHHLPYEAPDDFGMLGSASILAPWQRITQQVFALSDAQERTLQDNGVSPAVIQALRQMR